MVQAPSDDETARELSDRKRQSLIVVMYVTFKEGDDGPSRTAVAFVEIVADPT